MVKAADFDSVIREFESLYPFHFYEIVIVNILGKNVYFVSYPVSIVDSVTGIPVEDSNGNNGIVECKSYLHVGEYMPTIELIKQTIRKEVEARMVENKPPFGNIYILSISGSDDRMVIRCGFY